MIELTFGIGVEIVEFRIEGKKIFMSGKPTNYHLMEWDPVGMSVSDLSKLRVRKGEEWYKSYLKAEEQFKSMKDEETMAKDLIIDMEKGGMKLLKENGLN